MAHSRRKRTIEEVRNGFEEKGLTLISKEYKNNKTPLEYVCKCGNKSKISWNALIKGQGCNVCGQKKSINSRRLNFNTVKQNIEQHGFKLLSKPNEYKNFMSQLKYICKCGEEHIAPYQQLKRGAGCRECGMNKVRHTEDHIREIFKRFNCEWLGGEYKNRNNSKLSFRCRCGNKDEVTVNSLLSTRRKSLHCMKCVRKQHGIRHSGENHPRYNPELTQEEREQGRDYKEYLDWRKQVYKRDRYKCVCCGAKNRINAHHLDSYSKHRYLRTVTSNGVTLCVPCHKEFHSIYGNSNNNALQFRDFMKSKGKTFETKSQQLSIL